MAERLLFPLLEGKPVVLAVTDGRLPNRKRINGKPLLFITPASCFGGSPRKLVVSLQTHGCEVIDVDVGLQSIAFHRLGLSIRLCRQLVDALDLVFSKGKNHG